MFSCGNRSDLMLSAFDSAEFKDLSSCVVTRRGIELVNSSKAKAKLNILHFTSHKILEMVSKLLFFLYSGGYSPSYVYRLVSELYHADDNYL